MSDSPPSRKRPRTEEPVDANLPKLTECPDWTTLDEGQVSEVVKDEAVEGAAQAEEENEDEEMDEREDRVRDEDFWFKDGTVVLVAEGVEFRVYRGPLVDQSPVFKDLFSQREEDGGLNAHSNAALNEHASATSNADRNAHSATDSDAGSGTNSDSGCPTVELTDSAGDLRHILRVFLPNRDPAPYVFKSPSFDAISASIRLGTKYQMPRLVQHTLEYLKDYYPSSFDVWQKHTKGPPGFTARHAIGVVNLARLTGEDTLLPIALLTCCGLDEAIVRGCKREDGSREQLSLDDIGLCFWAKGKLIEAAVEMCLRITSSSRVSPHCAHKKDLRYIKDKSRNVTVGCSGNGNTNPCRQALRNAALELPGKIHSLCSGWSAVNLLWSFERFYHDFGKGLCDECWAMVQDRDLAERRETWNRLPELLGITVDGWGCC